MSQKNTETIDLPVSPELKEVLKSTGIAIWEYDLRKSCLISLINIEEILGYSLSEISASFSYNDRPIISPADIEMLRTALNEYLLGQTRVFSADLQPFCKDGRRAYIHIQSTRLEKDAAGRPQTLKGIVQDISQKAEVATQQEHFRKMQAIGCLAAGISHNFNNLLQVIIGYTEIVIDQLKSAGLGSEDAKVVLDAGDQAMELIKQLLSFSSSGELKLESLPLGGVVESLVALIQPIVGENIDVQFEDQTDGINVQIDPVLLEQLIMNLMVNSSDAMQKGQIRVTTRTESLAEDLPSMRGIIPAGDYAVITVEDNGPGIDKNKLYRVFEPFYSSKQHGRGTGMGLAIVYAIVERHEGYIKLESSPGEGVAVHIYLRVSDHMHPSSWAPKTPEAESSEPQVETILIAEDDEMVRRLAVRILTDEGYGVIEAVDGVDAVDKFFKFSGKISLVILDIVMPKLNGKYAYAKISAENPEVPVLFSSGYSCDLLQSDHMMRLPGRLLQKPYYKQDFLSTVKNAIIKGNQPDNNKS